MPAAGGEIAEETVLCLLRVDMEWLRIVILCEGYDLVCIENVLTAFEGLTDPQIV